MNDTNTPIHFERSHDILINATPSAVLDYVCNPNSWPEWLAASHHIDSEDRPLRKGDHFVEKWHTKTGEAILNWSVTDCEPGKYWIGETYTDFLGTIIVRYDVTDTDGQTRFTRTVINPSRPKAATDKMIAAMDEEAKIALANIKRNVEMS
ncbi:SRPBCC family protein [Sneathiella glossodoripedis]|uniref:SRPBCC family protein n=1 Tax=Sneathiella glossodoripedis TaxID=418853 RepID=UPI000471648C|nr:SRPBCC family protein [Sneathiella glossodoripedis]